MEAQSIKTFAEFRSSKFPPYEGEEDDISGVGQTQAAHGLCPNIPDTLKLDYVQPGVGHYGVFNGRRFREEIYPRVRGFIRKCDPNFGEEA